MKPLDKIILFVRQRVLDSKWLIVQIGFTYLVLFGAFTWLLDWVEIYKEPASQQINKVYTVSLESDKPSYSNLVYAKRVIQDLSSHPNVQTVCISSFNTPYTNNTISWQVNYETKKLLTEMRFVDQNYARVLGIDILQGRWLTQADSNETITSVVINTTLSKKIFKNQPAVGQRIYMSEPPFTGHVIGVVNYRGTNDEFERAHNELFLPAAISKYSANFQLLLRSKNELTARQEAELIEKVKKTTSIEIRFDEIAEQKRAQHHLFLLRMGTKGAVVGFCSVFCLIGLMGTLLTELYKRREEVGLRRVVGATAQHIWIQLVIEYWYLSIFVMSLASIITVQFPLLEILSIPSALYLKAMFLSSLSILSLVASFIVKFYYPLQRFTPAHSMKPFH